MTESLNDLSFVVCAVEESTNGAVEGCSVDTPAGTVLPGRDACVLARLASCLLSGSALEVFSVGVDMVMVLARSSCISGPVVL